MAVVFFAAFFVTSSSALNNSPSLFEIGDGNMTLETSGNTDWNCFQGTTGFATLASGTPAGCLVTSGATNNSSPDPKFGQTPGEKFDTACPTTKAGNSPPKDVWSDVAQYLEVSPTLNSDNGHDIYFYGAAIRPVVNGNSSGNIYFSQGTNPNGANCRTVGDVLLTFDFLGGGSKPTLHILTWQGANGSCFVGNSDPATGCWGPSSPPTITGANSDGETNAAQINGTANALNGQTILANGFSEIGVNLTQAIKLAGGTTTCFANETWVSRSSGSSFTSSPEMVVNNSTPTCGSITIIKHTNPRGLNQQFTYTATGTGITSPFHLNDGGHTNAIDDVACVTALGAPRDSTVASPCNARTFSNLSPANYSVTEGSDPTGFAFSSVSCKKNGTAVSSGSGGLTITNRTVSISLGISENWVCTYVNNQQLGAIKIVKKSTKTAQTLLNGAHFQICSNDGPYNTGANHDQNPCVPVQTGSGDLVTAGTGTSAGAICIQNLAFGSNYFVSEKTPPAGYANDAGATTTQVTVNVNTTCSGSPQTVTYTDTPLTDISAHVESEATGGTQSNIHCKNSSNAEVGNSPEPDSGNAASATVTANGLAPGTYTCTIIIDP